MKYNKLDLQNELTRVVEKTEWNIKGIIHVDDTISPLPAESRVVTEIFQSMLIRKLQVWAKSKNLEIRDNALFTRGYPDITLKQNKNLVAIDVKSARVKKGERISAMTLGTYDGYFLHPNEKKLHNKTLCYNDYSEHWIISVIYEWFPDKETQDIVKIKAVCVGEKWEFASKTSGSGDTANIGGITSLEKLKIRDSIFKNNEEFEAFWRNYSIKHPRRGMKVPKFKNL